MGGRPLQLRELLTVGIFTLASIGAICAVWLAFGGSLPLQASGYRFTTSFSDARTLVANADVRIAGIPVGHVVKVKPGEDQTEATIELESKYAPLPRDARAILRNKTPLGESYIEITRGTPSKPKIPDGGRMAAGNVQQSQQIEQVLGAFDRPTRKAFQTFVLDAAASLQGKGEDLNEALGASGPAVDDVGTVVDALDRQSKDVSTLVHDTGTALRALGERPEDLRGLVRSGNEVLSTTAERNRQLTATIRNLAPFVRNLRLTMADLQTTVDLAAPTLRTLRPVTPLLAPALRQANVLLPSTKVLLRDLRPTLTALRRANPPARSLVRELRPASVAINRAGAQTIPTLQLLSAYRKDAIWNLAGTAQTFAYRKEAGNGKRARYGRAAISLVPVETQEGSPRRGPESRYNPYPAPGSQILQTAYDCRNTSNPPTMLSGLFSQIPCRLEPPWSFRGQKRSFPKLTPYVPKP